MPTTIRVSIRLPYLLALPGGNYKTPSVGGSVRLTKRSITNTDGTPEARTDASTTFKAFPGGTASDQERQRHTEAEKLLRRVNHLLRWYRVKTGQATIIELTKAQAGAFHFRSTRSGVGLVGDPELTYQAAAFPVLASGNLARMGAALRTELSRKSEPDAAELNVLDARYSLSVGRFRESVLLCWAAIDSTFVRKFKGLVSARLKGRWKEGYDFLNGPNLGLRQKMTFGLLLLNCPSMHSQPDNFWDELSESYKLRNKIIHEGQVAQESDAELAIKVAQGIVRIVASLPDN